MTRAEVLVTVQDVLSKALQSAGGSLPPLTDSAHLLADLGLTSLNLAEVVIGLEDALGISEFPITDWLKLEAQRSDAAALTVGSLVDACLALVAKKKADATPAAKTPPVVVTAGAASTALSSKGSMAIAWMAAAFVVCAAIAAALITSR